MSKASDAGKAFLTGVLAKVPEALRAQVETALTAPESEAALEVLGTGALAQPDINRRYQELQKAQEELESKRQEVEATYTRQSDWWAANEPKVKEYDRIKPEYDTLKGSKVPDPTVPPNYAELEKKFNEQLAALQQQGVGVMAYMTELGLKHFAEFGEKIDMTALLADVGKHNSPTYGLPDAYMAKYGEQVKARAQKAEDDRINKLVEERFKERSKGDGQPYPLRNQAPSALDALEHPTDKPATHDVETATALYEQLQAARGA